MSKTIKKISDTTMLNSVCIAIALLQKVRDSIHLESELFEMRRNNRLNAGMNDLKEDEINSMKSSFKVELLVQIKIASSHLEDAKLSKDIQ